jgi:hypothetical protein
MSSKTLELPTGFADLQPFVDWVLPTEKERYAKRISSTMDELQSFYDAALALANDAVAHLEHCPMESIADEDKHLLWMYCSIVTVSFAVEVWRQPRVPDSGAASFDEVVAPAV